MKLSDLFPIEAVHVKVQATNKAKTKALVVAYLDARDVMDRLDACTIQWSDSYRVLNPNPPVVECALEVEGVVKTDVGEGDAFKDAYSDALKRAAVKWGVGRYLYRADQAWVEIDDRGRIKDPEGAKRKLIGKFYDQPARLKNVRSMPEAASSPAASTHERVSMKALQAMCTICGLGKDDRELRLRFAELLIPYSLESYSDLKAPDREIVYKTLRYIRDKYASLAEEQELVRRHACIAYFVSKKEAIADRDRFKAMLEEFDAGFWNDEKAA